MQREGASNILILLVSASKNALFGPSHRGTCAFCI